MSTPAPYPAPWPGPRSAPPAPGRPLTSGFAAMAVAVQLGLAAVIVISGWVAVLSVRGLLIVQRIQYGDYDAADEASGLMREITVMPVLYAIAYIAAGAMFITWVSWLRRSDRVAAEAMRYGPGWAIGGWLIPIVNFFRPYQVMTDLWRGLARPWVAHQAPHQPPTPTLLRVWWGAFLGASIGGRLLYATLQGRPSTLTTARTAFTVEIVVEVATVAAAVLAIMVVRAFTARAKVTPPVWQVSPQGFAGQPFGPPGQQNAPWAQPYPNQQFPTQQYPYQTTQPHPGQPNVVQPGAPHIEHPPNATPASPQHSPWQRTSDPPPGGRQPR